MIAVKRRVVAVLVLVVNRQPVLHVPIAAAEIALMEQAGPIAVMRLQQKATVAPAPRFRVEPGGPRAPLMEVAYVGQTPPAPEDREVLCPRRQAAGQRHGIRVQRLRLGRAGAEQADQRRSEQRHQLKPPFVPFQAFRERLDRPEPALQQPHRLLQRGAGEATSRGGQEVGHALQRAVCFAQMVCENRRLRAVRQRVRGPAV
jgi:hypothetical protein